MRCDAAGIESAFAVLLGGKRGGMFGSPRADTFQFGEPPDLGKLLQKAADVLEEGIGKIEFEPWELSNGEPKSRLQLGVQGARKVGRDMEKMVKREPADYHWLVVGQLVQIAGSLLDHIEGKTRP